MCVSCVTSADAIAWSAVGGAAAAGEGWRRLRARAAGWTRSELRQEAWDADAAFLRRLGHEPEALLGERPDAAAVRA